MEAEQQQARDHLEELRDRLRMRLEYPQGAIRIENGAPAEAHRAEPLHDPVVGP